MPSPIGEGILVYTMADIETRGPKNGTLMITGGGGLWDEFVELAGGEGTPIVAIPTAQDDGSLAEKWGPERVAKEAENNIAILHTRDRDEANSEAFVQPIREAKAVHLSGGRHWRLADSYLNTLVHEELKNLLARGGVIAGGSAGATIQGSYMVRGDTAGNHIMMGDHTEGLGFVQNATFDQHLLQRNRHFDLIEVIERYPHLLGIGLDVDTGIVVRGDEFEVIGKHRVAVYDYTHVLNPDGKFYFLLPGAKYNMRTREPLLKGNGNDLMDRLEKKAWSELAG